MYKDTDGLIKPVRLNQGKHLLPEDISLLKVPGVKPSPLFIEC